MYGLSTQGAPRAQWAANQDQSLHKRSVGEKLKDGRVSTVLSVCL